jgi:hypothetical protein
MYFKFLKHGLQIRVRLGTGGKTSGGILEATVDQIQLGTYTKKAVF